MFHLSPRYLTCLDLYLLIATVQKTPAPAQKAHPGTALTPATPQRQRMELTWYINSSDCPYSPNNSYRYSVTSFACVCWYLLMHCFICREETSDFTTRQ